MLRFRTRGRARWAARGRQHSSKNAAISPVSRRGATRSSISELASNNRPFGSSDASMPASENGWIEVVLVADHQRRRLDRRGARSRGGADAAEEQALQHGGARLRVLADPVEQDVGLPRQRRRGTSRAARASAASRARRRSARPSSA